MPPFVKDQQSEMFSNPSTVNTIRLLKVIIDCVDTNNPTKKYYTKYKNKNLYISDTLTYEDTHWYEFVIKFLYPALLSKLNNYNASLLDNKVELDTLILRDNGTRRRNIFYGTADEVVEELYMLGEAITKANS